MSEAADDWRSQPAQGWRRPAVGERPIEGYRYTIREFFAREFEHMWTKVWLLLGREEEMPNPGDWQREEVGPESILMARQKDGSVKAFYNVCQHRGNRLVFAGKGHVRRFVCRYHSWAFLPDGSLNFAQDAEDFPQGNPCENVRLVEHEIIDYGDKSIGLGMDQDLSITTGQQLGFRSRGYKGVYLSGQEARIRRYHEVMDEYIQGIRPHGRFNARPMPVWAV